MMPFSIHMLFFFKAENVGKPWDCESRFLDSILNIPLPICIPICILAWVIHWTYCVIYLSICKTTVFPVSPSISPNNGAGSLAIAIVGVLVYIGQQCSPVLLLSLFILGLI